MVKDDGGRIVGDGDVVDAVMNIQVIIFFKVVKGNRVNRNKLARGSVEKRECGGTKEVRVLDAFRKIGDNKFLDGVLDVDAIGDGVRDEGAVGVYGSGGDGMKDKGGGGGMRKGVGKSSGVEVVHDVVRRAIKLELVDGKGHMRCSWGAEEGVS